MGRVAGRSVSLFGPHAPSKNTEFPNHANFTAVELIAFFPYIMKHYMFCYRLTTNGMTSRLFTVIVNFHRRLPDGATNPNSTYKMCAHTMRTSGRCSNKWTFTNHPQLVKRDVAKSGRPWTPWLLDVHGMTTEFPNRSGGRAAGAQEYSFAALARDVKNMPEGDDALDLTRMVKYAVQHPETTWMFPRDYDQLLQLVGGPKPFTPQHWDQACFERWNSVKAEDIHTNPWKDYVVGAVEKSNPKAQGTVRKKQDKILKKALKSKNYFRAATEADFPQNTRVLRSRVSRRTPSQEDGLTDNDADGESDPEYAMDDVRPSYNEARTDGLSDLEHSMDDVRPSYNTARNDGLTDNDADGESDPEYSMDDVRPSYNEARNNGSIGTTPLTANFTNASPFSSSVGSSNPPRASDAAPVTDYGFGPVNMPPSPSEDSEMPDLMAQYTNDSRFSSSVGSSKPPPVYKAATVDNATPVLDYGSDPVNTPPSTSEDTEMPDSMAEFTNDTRFGSRVAPSKPPAASNASPVLNYGPVPETTPRVAKRSAPIPVTMTSTASPVLNYGPVPETMSRPAKRSAPVPVTMTRTANKAATVYHTSTVMGYGFGKIHTAPLHPPKMSLLAESSNNSRFGSHVAPSYPPVASTASPVLDYGPVPETTPRIAKRSAPVPVFIPTISKRSAPDSETTLRAAKRPAPDPEVLPTVGDESGSAPAFTPPPVVFNSAPVLNFGSGPAMPPRVAKRSAPDSETTSRAAKRFAPDPEVLPTIGDEPGSAAAFTPAPAVFNPAPVLNYGSGPVMPPRAAAKRFAPDPEVLPTVGDESEALDAEVLPTVDNASGSAPALTPRPKFVNELEPSPKEDLGDRAENVRYAKFDYKFMGRAWEDDELTFKVLRQARSNLRWESDEMEDHLMREEL